MKGTVFNIVDVFAQEKYAGNQLAVFRDAGGSVQRDDAEAHERDELLGNDVRLVERGAGRRL